MNILQPKSEEDIFKALQDIKNPFIRYQTIIDNEFSLKYLPTKKELEENLELLYNTAIDTKIWCIIRFQLNFNLLPRNNDGICVCNDSLYIRAKGITKLPNNLSVNGDLDCRQNKLTKLPNGLRVNGTLWCNENYLTKLPEDLYVKGEMFSSHNKIKLELPESAYVKYDFIN